MNHEKEDKNKLRNLNERWNADDEELEVSESIQITESERNIGENS